MVEHSNQADSVAIQSAICRVRLQMELLPLVDVHRNFLRANGELPSFGNEKFPFLVQGLRRNMGSVV